MMLRPPVAAAATSCTADSCEGKDPVATGCSADALLIDEANFGTQLDARLYRSPNCDAVWAKVVMDPSEPSTFMQWGELFFVPELGGTEQAYGTGLLSTDSSTGYTAMASGDDSVKACFTSDGDGYDPSPEDWAQGGSGLCTAWN